MEYEKTELATQYSANVLAFSHSAVVLTKKTTRGTIFPKFSSDGNCQWHQKEIEKGPLLGSRQIFWQLLPQES